jgi:hypothetical protein
MKPKKDLLALLIELYADQEGVTISYTFERSGKDEERKKADLQSTQVA